MNTGIKPILLKAMVLILLFTNLNAQGVEKLNVRPDKSSNDSSMPDPHWQSSGCPACHEKAPVGKSLHLKQSNSEKLCNACHATISQHSYIHPTGMRVSKKMLARAPVEFREAIKKENGRLGCRTCHDLTKTCKKVNSKERLTNPRFFRGGPYQSRTDICYLCHDDSKYKRLNPHDQLVKGKLQEQTCLVCHKSSEKLDSATSIDQVDFNLTDNLARMCTGCHPYKPHPGGSFSFSGKGKPNHLVRPSKQVANRMKSMSIKNGIILPLAPGSGEIFCGTCHNPHQKGVIKTAVAARGAGSKKRLRMQKICANCHDK